MEKYQTGYLDNWMDKDTNVSSTLLGQFIIAALLETAASQEKNNCGYMVEWPDMGEEPFWQRPSKVDRSAACW